jgi:hypothetical protein
VIRCGSCGYSRWVHRLRFADELEWLTGWTLYGCVACARRGLHRSRPVPPAIDEIRGAFSWISRRWSASVAEVWFSRRVGATAGAVIAVVLGLTLTVMLLSRSTTGADRESAPRLDQADRAPVASTAGLDPAAIIAPAADPLGSPPADSAALPLPAVPVPMAPVVQEARTGPASGAHQVSAAGPVERAESPRDAKQAGRAARSGEEHRQKDSAAAAGRRAPEKSTRASARTAAHTPNTRRAPNYRGTLTIRSEPSAAAVFVDGQAVGSTPLVLDAIAIGSRVIRIEAPGYERWSSVARVVANRKTSIDASLKQSGR